MHYERTILILTGYNDEIDDDDKIVYFTVR